jgi:hypothetical protein
MDDRRVSESGVGGLKDSFNGNGYDAQGCQTRQERRSGRQRRTTLPPSQFRGLCGVSNAAPSVDIHLRKGMFIEELSSPLRRLRSPPWPVSGLDPRGTWKMSSSSLLDFLSTAGVSDSEVEAKRDEDARVGSREARVLSGRATVEGAQSVRNMASSTRTRDGRGRREKKEPAKPAAYAGPA